VPEGQGVLDIVLDAAQRLVREPLQPEDPRQRSARRRRLLCFSLFWHALDIIWVGLFSVVYLMGVAQ
jgi:heme/copper-type cytochrome/quinol oxidase subunit 3